MAAPIVSTWDRLLAEREARLPHIDDVLLEHAQKRILATPPRQHHPPTTPPSADALVCAARVADTPELLELILANLPPIDIVRSTHVSISFRNLIRTSPTLQRKTFMRQPKPTTSAQHCQFVQWGPGLAQRNIKLLPTNSVVDDTPIEAFATHRNKTFQPMMILLREAVKTSQLCPLLEVAESTSIDTPGRHWPPTLAALNRVDRRLATTARFRGRTTLIMSQPRDVSARAAGATATSSSSSSFPTPLPPTKWAHMQLSNPPTHHAHLELRLEGRLRDELKVVLEANRCMQRSRSEPGITAHDLMHFTSGAIGSVAIKTPYFRTVNGRTEEVWTTLVKRLSSIAACIAEVTQENRGVPYEWSVGAKSEVILPGVVVPTEGELERLAEMDGLSSTPLPMVIDLVDPEAEEEEGDQGDQGGQQDQREEDDADDEAEEEDEVSGPASDSPTE